MTEQQMNQLADIIVSKIISRQAEYDAEFMRILAEEGNLEVDFHIPKPIKTDEEILSQLEARLQKAIEEEDYMRAETLKKSIQKLKNKL